MTIIRRLFTIFTWLLHLKLCDCQTCRRLDIGFILDGSGSVSQEHWGQMLSFVKEFAGRVRYGPDDIRVGVVSYGDAAALNIALATHPTLSGFRSAVDGVDYLNQGTNTAAGIRVLRTELFSPDKGDRPGVPNVALVLTDGESNVQQEDTIPEADAAKRDDIIVFAVGIGNNLNQRELNAIASRPASLYVYNVKDFQTLLDSVGQITNSACKILSSLPEPDCRYDIGFVLDSSGSIGKDNWERLKEFTISFLRRLTIGENSTKVGVVTFSTQSQLVINFDRFESAAALEKAVSNLGWKNHRTHTAAGLLEANTNLFSATGGERNDSENVVVILTDGKINVNKGHTIIEADKLRSSKDVRVFTVAVGTDVRMAELTGIADKPSYYHTFIMRDYSQLVARADLVFNNVCGDNKPSPQKDYSSCQADIAFVLDESGSVGATNWERMLQFVANFASRIPFGPKANRVGVVKFGSSASLAVRLDSYNNSSGFAAAVAGLSYSTGGTNTAAGLAATTDRLFAPQHGDRANVSNIAIVLTDGASNNRDETLAEAERARAHGITLFAIGIGNKLTQSELQSIANDPDEEFLFYSSDFEALVGDYGKILGYACFAAATENPVWSCDFEDDENSTSALCGIQQTPSEQFDWTVWSGQTPSAPTGPKAAYHGVQYLYTEASSPRFTIPHTAEKTGDYCLTFFRHMFGYHIGALQVFLRRKFIGDITVWNLKGQQGSEWRLQYVDLHLETDDQIGIRSIRWNGYAGDMALDDIKLINGPCPYS